MAGRPKKPTQLKIIHGTFRKHRAKRGEPKPRLVDTAPPAPRHLNGYGKWIWRRLAPELVEKQLLTVLDLPALEICCDAYGFYRAARLAMLRGGRRNLQQYLAGRNSQTSPEGAMMRQCWATFKGFMAEFGLSPSSRAKLDIPAPKSPEQDPMERLLDEG